MFYLLIDTCVWLDLAKDPTQKYVLDLLEEMIQRKELSLIVPSIIIEEFNRNKEDIPLEISKNISSALKSVKYAADKMPDNPKNRKAFKDQLDDIEYKIPTYRQTIVNSIKRIEKLLNNSKIIELSDSIKLRVFQRSFEKKAPFHKKKNNVNDAVIIEIYADYIQHKHTSNTQYAFITHNIHDFSIEHDNNKIHHPDFDSYFSPKKSFYFIKLTEALQKINPIFVTDAMVEDEAIMEPRSFTDILNAEGEFLDKVWYNRHQNWLYRIEIGEDKIVDKVQEGKYQSNITPKEIFVAARKAAKKIEKRYGKKNLGPYSDFEWGMINGKLSALRWVTGWEWDFLDT